SLPARRPRTGAQTVERRRVGPDDRTASRPLAVRGPRRPARGAGRRGRGHPRAGGGGRGTGSPRAFQGGNICMKARRTGVAVMLATLGGSAAVAVASGEDPSAAAIPMPGAETCAGVAAIPDAAAAAAVMSLVNVLRERAGRVRLARSKALSA